MLLIITKAGSERDALHHANRETAVEHPYDEPSDKKERTIDLQYSSMQQGESQMHFVSERSQALKTTHCMILFT